MNSNEIGQRLYSLRIKAGQTQEEVAEASGISQVSLGRYENGVRIPKIDVLTRIAAHFNVSIDELTGHTSDQSEGTDEEPLSAVAFALYGEMHDTTEEEKADLLDYLRFLKSKRGRK